ncbi:uncharacterized protein EDB93DRAFT_754704 [Suillus bovinus]|uniref:uncharacterized protein n=1 Tax=Suillus bovinus TaxID=48563 RepID=UPI001B8730CD|nr:uncharacterized protein EDB93DRAFT_754704 [Suillus bovinus]KAG2137873.1 hypothetical protein EDB93DRAFT_754704 [Suillus bovinus]
MLTEDITHWQNVSALILSRGGRFSIFHYDQQLYPSHRTEMRSRLLSVASGSSPLENTVQLSSAVVIIFEHSFYIYDNWRYLQDQQKSDPSYYLALEQYMASPHAAAVREDVSAAVQAYEEAVTAASHGYEDAVATAAHGYEEAVRTAVYPYEGHLPARMAKLAFEPFKRKAKEAFEL